VIEGGEGSAKSLSKCLNTLSVYGIVTYNGADNIRSPSWNLMHVAALVLDLLKELKFYADPRITCLGHTLKAIFDLVWECITNPRYSFPEFTLPRERGNDPVASSGIAT
jgi:hypothetical protein